jgi:hypothetical protein
MHNMQQILNCEALALYSNWLNNELEASLRNFLPDAIDEFQLEARLKDFQHEVFSFLMETTSTGKPSGFTPAGKRILMAIFQI